MPRKKQPARRRRGEGSYKWDEKNQRHVWKIDRDGKRYAIYDRDPDRAKARFAALKEQLDKKLDIISARQSLDTYTRYYLQKILPNEVGDSTVHDYAKRAGYYILPTLGDFALGDLKKPVIQAWVNAMVAKGWAITSIRQALSLLRRILETAVPEILEYNPAAMVKPPKEKAVQSADDDEEDSGRALTPEEETKVLDAVAGTFYELLFVLALRLGLRRGELLGLRWKDIDLEKHELRVRQQVKRLDKRIIVTPKLKTKNSRRTIPISEGIVTIVLAHMARVQTMRDKAGEAWTENDFVFPNEFGKYRRPDNLTTHCSRLFKRLKIEGHHLHDLRATAITRWRELGADDETTAALAGHENVKISVKVYSDAEARKRAIMSQMS